MPLHAEIRTGTAIAASTKHLDKEGAVSTTIHPRAAAWSRSPARPQAAGADDVPSYRRCVTTTTAPHRTPARRRPGRHRGRALTGSLLAALAACTDAVVPTAPRGVDGPRTTTSSTAPIAFNFRRTATFVSDGAGETYSNIQSDLYPTTRDGRTFGWAWTNSGPWNITADNTNATIDRRLAGSAFVYNVDTAAFRVDLPGPGRYRIRLAVGSHAAGTFPRVRLLDGGAEFTRLSVPTNAYPWGYLSAGRWMDAAGNRMSTAEWPTTNAAIERQFQSSTFVVVLGDPASGNADATALSHVSLERVDAPPVEPEPTDVRRRILDFAGPALSVNESEALGGPFARFENDFRWYEPTRWRTEGAGWESSNYYDRARIYYIWYARTGDTAYRDKGTAIALDYRRNYLEASNYGPSAHWAQMAGVALHYLVTGDTASRTAVGYVADNFAAPYYVNNLGNTSAEMDSRIQARVLTAFTYAWELRAPSRAGRDWAVLARDALTKILSSQSPDGAYRWQHSGQCGYNKPFEIGLLNDALIEYYRRFEADARILPAVRKAVDHLWTHDWDAASQSFVYLDGPCGGDGPFATPDLTNMMVSGFGWVYQMTGDTVYRNRGDQVFAGGVKGAYLAGGKQFNQAYHTSYRYAAFRKAGGGGPVQSLGPVMIASQSSGKCMELSGGERSPGAPLRIWDCWGGDSQRYLSIPAVGQTGELRHKYSDMCLQPANGGAADGESIVIQPCTGAAVQQWTRTQSAQLRQANGRCLDVSGGGTANGTPNVVATCSGSPSQRWDWKS